MSKQDNKKIPFSIVELSNYNAPKIVESYTQDKYISYGVNNSYFTYINDCYNGSATNRSVVNSIAQMIYGKGLDFIGSDEKEDVLKEIKDLFKPKDMRLLTMDFKQYGQCALQIGYNADHSKIVKVQHQPIMTITKAKMNSSGQINKYYYSANWGNTSIYKPKVIPAFGTSKSRVELLYINNYTYSSGLMYYSNVDYQAGLQYCTVEEEISNFHLNNILNGFAPSMLLTFHDGKPDVKEQLSIERKVKAKWGGSSKAGNIMISFVESTEEAPTLETVDVSKVSDQYQFVTELATDKILISHRVTSPLLLGIKDAAGFSSNAEELISSYKLFNLTVINPFQEILIDSLQEILLFNKIDEDVFFIPLMPIDFVDSVEEVDAVEVEKETGIDITEQTNTNEDGQD